MVSKAKITDKHLNSENIFCMIVTNRRLYQGFALLVSLFQVMKDDFFLFIHCVDEESYHLLKKLQFKNVLLLREKKLDKQIRALREERKIHEYCWTLKPVICEYVLNKYPEVKRITYLDSDLFFWETPTRIFENQQDCSVLLSLEEKYKPDMNQAVLRRRIQVTGLYNSGFISFKRDEVGLQALKWWKDKCLENCHVSAKEGLFGDQKYLDELAQLSPNICSIHTPGVNIGPWDEQKYQFTEANDSIYINDEPLVFFHFSGIRVAAKDTIQSIYRRNRNSRPFIYQLYKQVLINVVEIIERIDPDFNGFADEIDLQKYWN